MFVRRTERRTDGQTESSSLDRVCIPCSAAKLRHIIIKERKDLRAHILVQNFLNAPKSLDDDIAAMLII